MPDWTRALGRPEATAVLRDSTDDFVVEEVLGFEPSGDGEHTFLFVEKRNRTTDEVAVELARHAGVPRRAVSFAGLKDKRARTRQWFSVQCPPKREIDWHIRFARDVTILECARNRRKLRRGAHRANRFVLTLRDVRDPLDTLPTRLDALAEDGAPNYFGEQRFGRDGQNVEIAQRLFAG
ncbi:MAG: tRNA pseudouridine(13) synthase TruD, partial [Pseudomonadota bacterium]